MLEKKTVSQNIKFSKVLFSIYFGIILGFGSFFIPPVFHERTSQGFCVLNFSNKYAKINLNL